MASSWLESGWLSFLGEASVRGCRSGRVSCFASLKPPRVCSVGSEVITGLPDHLGLAWCFLHLAFGFRGPQRGNRVPCKRSTSSALKQKTE